MAGETTVVLGIPIPSGDPVFLAIIGIHIMFGLAAVITGAVAMLSTKGRSRHSNWGTIYHCVLRRRWHRWPRLHFIGMGASLLLLLST